MYAVRARLRELLGELRPGPGETLYAVFTGAIPANSDVENQLIYNILDSSSGVVLERGVRFELHDSESGAVAEYRYALAPTDVPFSHWREAAKVARWSNVLIPDGPADHLLSRTWWALRKAEFIFGDPLPAKARFGLRFTIQMPHRAGRLNPERLKKLIDGAVSAFQRHESSAEADRRIAARLALEPKQVAAKLADPIQAVLGRAEMPIRLTKTDVQWNPDDTRLVAAEVAVQVGDDAGWRISGRAFGVDATGSTSSPTL